MSKPGLSCSSCSVTACTAPTEKPYPQFCLTTSVDLGALNSIVEMCASDTELGRIARTAASIEGEFYGRMTRVEETIEFIKRMGYAKIGIATCVGLLNETKTFTRILRGNGIEPYVVGCKIGAVDKSEIGIPDSQKVNRGCGHESMCNPILQARTLAEQGTEFNVVIGLCVGHDTLFLRHSEAPSTVMIVKDRVLGHNPVAALYAATTGYSRFKDVLG